MFRKKKRKTKSHSLLILFVTLFVLSLFLASVTFKRNNNYQGKADEDTSSETKWKPYLEQISNGEIEKPQSILELNLTYDKSIANNLKFVNATKKNGFVPVKDGTGGEYLIKITDSQETVLHTELFSIPLEAHDPPPLNMNENSMQESNDRLNFTLTIPFLPGYDTLNIYKGESMIIKEKLDRISSNLMEYNNTPSFYSINGEDFIKQKELKKSSVNSLFNKVHAQEDNKNSKLDITFIGDKYNYSELDLFHKDVNNFVSEILNYEPFKSRASQITFNYVDNTTLLNCIHSSSMERLVTCDASLVTQRVNTAGVPNDKIVVITKDSSYGGSGTYGGIAVAYNGPWGPPMFVHEFGHSFGYLKDEYLLYNENGGLLNQTFENCYSGNPPASQWQGLVSSSEYTLSCNYPNWYRSSSSSIMLELSSTYFNKVSQNLLNKKIDIFTASATPICTEALPDVQVTNQTSGIFKARAIGVKHATNVKFGVWSYYNNQDDLKWYVGIKTEADSADGDTWEASIDLSQHSLGPYTNNPILVHAYMDGGPYSNIWCDTADFTITKSPITFLPTSTPKSVSGDQSNNIYKRYGDIDGNKEVNLDDLSLLATDWDKAGANLYADVDGKGSVDIIDLSILASNFSRKLPKFIR